MMKRYRNQLFDNEIALYINLFILAFPDMLLFVIIFLELYCYIKCQILLDKYSNTFLFFFIYIFLCAMIIPYSSFH